MGTYFERVTNVVLSNNNKTATVSPNSNAKCNNPKSEKGKYYIELKLTQKGAGITIGVGDSIIRTQYCGCDSTSMGLQIISKAFYHNAVKTDVSMPTFEINDVLGMGIDIDNKELIYYRNGVSFLTKSLTSIGNEIYVEIGTGSASGCTVNLLTKQNELMYYTDAIKQKYLPYDDKEYFCFIDKNTQYYTIKDNELVLLENQILDKTNFEVNGFKNLNLLTQENILYKETKQLESNMCEFNLDDNIDEVSMG